MEALVIVFFIWCGFNVNEESLQKRIAAPATDVKQDIVEDWSKYDVKTEVSEPDIPNMIHNKNGFLCMPFALETAHKGNSTKRDLKNDPKTTKRFTDHFYLNNEGLLTHEIMGTTTDAKFSGNFLVFMFGNVELFIHTEPMPETAGIKESYAYGMALQVGDKSIMLNGVCIPIPNDTV